MIRNPLTIASMTVRPTEITFTHTQERKGIYPLAFLSYCIRRIRSMFDDQWKVEMVERIGNIERPLSSNVACDIGCVEVESVDTC